MAQLERSQLQRKFALYIQNLILCIRVHPLLHSGTGMEKKKWQKRGCGGHLLTLRQLSTFVVDVVGDNLIYILIENLLEIIMNFSSHYLVLSGLWLWEAYVVLLSRETRDKKIGQNHLCLPSHVCGWLMLSVSIKYSIFPQQLLHNVSFSVSSYSAAAPHRPACIRFAWTWLWSVVSIG